MAETKPISLRLRPVTLAYIKELIRFGAYGENRSDVIRRFVEAGIVAALQGSVLRTDDIRAHGEDLDKAAEE